MSSPSNPSGRKTTDAEDALVGTVRDDRYLDRPHDVEIDGEYAYLPGKGGTFGIVDVSDPGSPEVVGGLRGLANAQTVGIEPGNPIVFLAEGESVHAVDVSEPAAPEIVGTASHESLDRVNGWARHGDSLFAASKSGWLTVVNVGSPRSPEHVGTFETRENHGVRSPHDAARHGEHVVVVNQTQGTHPKGGIVRVLDGETVRRPGGFELVATFDDDRLDGCNRVLVRDDHALVANNYAETVASVDLSTPESPEIAAVEPASEEGPNGITLYGGYLVAGSGRYVDLFDATSPEDLTLAARIEDHDRFGRSGSAHDLETVGDLVYVSAQAADRLNVYRLPPALDE